MLFSVLYQSHVPSARNQLDDGGGELMASKSIKVLRGCKLIHSGPDVLANSGFSEKFCH